MKVMCIIGVGCTGKSTYCKKLLDDYSKSKKPRPLLLQLGVFFRTVFGPDFFKTLDNPSVPAITENWVRSNVDMCITTAYQLNAGKPLVEHRDVIIDGVPRNPGQVYWLLLSSAINRHHIPLEIKALYAAEETIEIRIAARKELNPNEAELIDERQRKDVAMHQSVLKALGEGELKGVFTFEEINY